MGTASRLSSASNTTPYYVLTGGLAIIFLFPRLTTVIPSPLICIGVLTAINMQGQAMAFPVFFASFLFLFAASGVGNASTFQMIPAIMRKEVARLVPELDEAGRVKQSDKEAAAIIGFTSAIAAYGAFFIPKSFGTSIAATGSPALALYGFLAFYVSCIAVTWWFYTRPRGLLFDLERGRTPATSPALA